ncbi:unnamed protein product [Spirodela intermedia]|uniref:WRKY domain-containing protein n=1 Tax=Spirodela intermedia TaxID=51605 RepID=A0A7I8JPT1_SPIIN|nr:unnamed protein product [Spirodela intermedia]CAA6671573.1 unnamed protein product [Spirodela intermedia]
MENGVAWDPSRLIRELTDGQELTRQLETHLDQSPPEYCKSLLQSIQSVLHRATSLAKSLADYDGGDSPRSASGSDDSRRPMLPRWKKQVRANPGTSLEGPPEDGFSWRKYGQKDILGAAHPRGYYRCTHRNTQGCPATKQVQRADGDSSVFNVLYKGEHVCTQRANSSPMPVLEQGHSFVVDGRPGLTVITQELPLASPHPSPPFHRRRAASSPRRRPASRRRLSLPPPPGKPTSGRGSPEAAMAELWKNWGRYSQRPTPAHRPWTWSSWWTSTSTTASSPEIPAEALTFLPQLGHQTSPTKARIFRFLPETYLFFLPPLK